MSKFKAGDIVERINFHYDTFKIGFIGEVLETDLGNTNKMVTIKGHDGLQYQGNFKLSSKNIQSSKNKMETETLKIFNPKNLAEGKKEAIKEKANYELTESKKAYKILIDSKEEQERIIKLAQEKVKELNKKLAIF